MILQTTKDQWSLSYSVLILRILNKMKVTVPWSHHPALYRMCYEANKLAVTCLYHSTATKEGQGQGQDPAWAHIVQSNLT